MLGKLSEPLQHADWVRMLSQAEHNTVHRSVGTTPNKLLFGVGQRGIIVDKLTEFLEEWGLNPSERNLSDLRENASREICRVQEYM